MSLETLIEAANYLEYRSEAKARGEEPEDYPSFLQVQPQPSSSGGSSKHSLSRSPDYHQFDLFFDEVRDKRRIGGAGTREVHNKLEKNRRAHLKECFEILKKQLPSMDERKTSNLSILRGALRYIQTLKRKERDYEHEMEKLAREKIASQQKLAALKKELSCQNDNLDVSHFLPDHDNETTTTASECGAFSEDDTTTTRPENCIVQQQSNSVFARSTTPESISRSSSSSNSNNEGPSMLDTIAMAAATLIYSPIVPETRPASSGTVSPSEENKESPDVSSAMCSNAQITALAVSSVPKENVQGTKTNSLPHQTGTDQTPSLAKSDKSTLTAAAKTFSFMESSSPREHLSAPVIKSGSDLQLRCMAEVLASSPQDMQGVVSQGSRCLKTMSADLKGEQLHFFTSTPSVSGTSLVAITSGALRHQHNSTVLIQQGAAIAGSSGKVILSQSLIAAKRGNLQPLTLVSPSNCLTSQSFNGVTVHQSATAMAESNVSVSQKSQIRHALLSGTAVNQSSPILGISARQQPLVTALKSCQARSGHTFPPQFSGIAQIVSQSQIASATHNITSIVTAPVSVVSNCSPSSLIGTTSANSLGKALVTTPLLKNVTSLPLGASLLQPQTLVQPNSTIKPLVVVTMAGNSQSGVTLNLPITQ